jgi:hypothetical protein
MVLKRHFSLPLCASKPTMKSPPPVSMPGLTPTMMLPCAASGPPEM